MSSQIYTSALAQTASEFDVALADLLASQRDDVPRIWDAMRYASLAGGKRLRPFLVLTCDLPAMDDDDMRRGQPTLHRKFDEATAILAGDALLTLAFEVLADPATHHDGQTRAELVLGLARAGGARGMAGGQMLDLEAEIRPVDDENQVMRLESMKTGALFAWSCEAGAVVAGAGEKERTKLRAFGAEFGMAFQITDDILDETGNPDEAGKAVGKDSERGKATLVSLRGLDGARDAALDHAQKAVENLDLFGEKADLLRAAATQLIDRRV
jgi:farnesyl diphosphate synthase